MPYQTGSASDVTALRAAITSFAASNGWAWDNVNNILSKGAVFATLTTTSGTSAFGGVLVQTLRIQGGTGASAGALVNPTAGYAEIRDIANYGVSSNSIAKQIVWPVTYHLFVNTAPDDLVCLINFDTSYWEWLGLGQCTNLGVPGAATWCGASAPKNSVSAIQISASGASSGYYLKAPCAPFWSDKVTDGYFPMVSSWLHCALDGSDGTTYQWACDNDALIGRFFQAFTPLLERQPNAWNSETLLVPARIAVPRPSGLWSYAAEMPHARLLRVNNYNGGDLITLGSDTWFVAPFFRQNASAQTASDSGTWGWAIRKTP